MLLSYGKQENDPNINWLSGSSTRILGYPENDDLKQRVLDEGQLLTIIEWG